MKRLTTLLATFLAALIIIAAASGPTVAAERPLFYNVTSDDAWTAGMALAQANVAVERGHPVTIFLNIRGVTLANRNAEQSTFGPDGKTAAQQLASLIDKGETVLVCGTCMTAAGLTDKELIDGARRTGPDTTFPAMTAEGTIVLSY